MRRLTAILIGLFTAALALPSPVQPVCTLIRGPVPAWNAAVVLRSQRKWPAKLWSIVLAVSCLTVLWVGIVFRIVGVSANY